MIERHLVLIPLCGGIPIKIKYAKESVSPDTYYDYIHKHNFLEICMVKSGKMFHFANGRTYRLKYGDIFFCRSNEMHYALAAEKSVYERLALWIPENAFEWIKGANSATLGAFLDSKYFGTNVFTLSPGCMDEFGRLMDSLAVKVKNPDSEYHFDILAGLADLLIFINRQIYGNADTYICDINRETPHIIYDVVSYVRENYKTIESVGSVADHFYINKDYLTRIFKKYFGFTVHDYLLSIRIGKSKLFLKKGKSVTEAAYECGFNSTSYFIRLFSKATGMTPAEYKAVGKDMVENKE